MKIKQCPFCGGKGGLKDHRLMWAIVCEECGACVIGERAEEPETDEDCKKINWDYYINSVKQKWNLRGASDERKDIKNERKDIKN